MTDRGEQHAFLCRVFNGPGRLRFWLRWLVWFRPWRIPLREVGCVGLAMGHRCAACQRETLKAWQSLSHEVFARVWNNPEDARFDDL